MSTHKVRLKNDLCVEWDVKLLLYHTTHKASPYLWCRPAIAISSTYLLTYLLTLVTYFQGSRPPVLRIYALMSEMMMMMVVIMMMVMVVVVVVVVVMPVLTA